MRVIIREVANGDLDRIFAWIAKERPQSAHAVIDRILNNADRLGHFPHMGHVGRRRDTLEWVVPGLPYIIVYRINAGEELIDVIAVVHGAQDRERER